MRNTIAASLAALSLIIPLSAFAQEDASPTGGYCPTLTRDLKRGDLDANTGGQVTELQKFIVDYYDLNPSDFITGYFGRLTQQNVMRFQSESSITPVSGYVGPKTRAAIANACSTASHTQATNYSQGSYNTSSYSQGSYYS